MTPDPSPFTWGYAAWSIGFAAAFVAYCWVTVEGIPRLLAFHRRGMSRLRRVRTDVTVQGER